MKTQDLPRAARISPADAPTLLSVVLVYENAAARERIEGVYAHLLGKLSKDFEFGCTWCSFYDFKDARNTAEFTAAAVDADLIVFSSHAEIEPPLPLRDWVEGWVHSKKAQDAVLAALLFQNQDSEDGPQSLHSYLREVAQRGGMDFLSQVVVGPNAMRKDKPAGVGQNRACKFTGDHNAYEASPLTEY